MAYSISPKNYALNEFGAPTRSTAIFSAKYLRASDPVDNSPGNYVFSP